MSRTLRFWVLVCPLTTCALAAYAVSCGVHFHLAADSPSLLTSTPLYLFGNIDPAFFFFFFAAMLFLVFDAHHRDVRDRVSEALHTRPVRNFELLAGRVLASTALLWMVAAAPVLLMVVFGFLDEVSGTGYGGMPQLHSVFNLIFIDAPAALIAWCSFFVFLSTVVRFRLLTVLIAFAAMFVWHFVVTTTPYPLLEITSPSSNDALFVSDVVPELSTTPTLLVRIATVFCSVGLLGATAWIHKRRDDTSRQHRNWTVGLGVAGVVVASIAVAHVLHKSHEVSVWREVHQAHSWDIPIDVQSIEGSVHIDPRSRMTFDLSLDFVVDQPPNASNLTFVLNPGMKISEVVLGGVPQDFTFKNGLLQIGLALGLNPSEVHSVRVVASGRPNPRFAYLGSQLDYLADPNLPIQVAHAFGVDGSVYDRKYVALMPGSHWYPFPKAVREDSELQTNTDYFDLDLMVEVAEPKWRLVGTSVARSDDTDTNSYLVQTIRPVPEFGLFASKFESASTDLEGTTFGIHLHERHKENLRQPPQSAMQELRGKLKESIDETSRLGLHLSQDAISLVEVPSRLRTVGGGWRMGALSSLPGVVLVRERGFPVADLARVYRSGAESEEVARMLELFPYLGLGTDVFLRDLPEHYWTHFTSATGEHSLTLDLIVKSLLWNMPQVGGSLPFSAYATMHLVPLTLLNASIAWDIIRANQPVMLARNYLPLLERSHFRRNNVWDLIENVSIAELPSVNGHRDDLELVLLKSTEIAAALIEFNDRDYEAIARWLVAVRNKFAGRTYEYEDLLEAAREHSIIVDPFLTDWLTSSSMPGFVFSPVETVRIADDSEGSARVQVSFAVRNTEPVDGFVVPRYSQGVGEPVLVEGHSAKRINLVLSGPQLQETTYRLSIYCGVSLNRGTKLFVLDLFDLPSRPGTEPGPFEEETEWEPDSTAVVVDDLDEGFKFVQPKFDASGSQASGPIGWFRSTSPNFEYVAGWRDSESLYYPRRGFWVRRTDTDAFGRYRQTMVVTKVNRHTEVELGRFEAKIPESGRWELDYHVVQPYYQPVGEVALRIRSGAESWDAEIDLSTATGGWNRIGEFTLDEGTASVGIVGSDTRDEIYADAIRWRRVDGIEKPTATEKR